MLVIWGHPLSGGVFFSPPTVVLISISHLDIKNLSPSREAKQTSLKMSPSIGLEVR